ncbi:MAG: HAMP domain-containing histidine kinase [Thermoleophilia bacterium]|nr:HAMP domain-containing histidine kinase [Thermoleophilia bacterium]
MLDRAPVDVHVLLQAAARRFESAARDRDVSVTIAAASDLPRISVDAARMHQVIGNLVANALAHAPRGSAVALSASRPANGHGVMLSVTDAGPGIEPSRLPTVFEAFAQGKRPTGSVGLGLTIVREFVRAHGGTVDVTSEPGCTCFDITLPAAAVQQADRRGRRLLNPDARFA